MITCPPEQMKVSLLHPSWNREARTEETISEWLGMRSGLHTIEYIISIDHSEHQPSLSMTASVITGFKGRIVWDSQLRASCETA